MAKTLEQLRFRNSYARLPAAFHSRVAPTPLENPRLVSFNAEAAALIGLDPQQALRPEFVAWLNGEHELPGCEPLAALYSGHQFGSYVSQLGDGRAILLGEVETDDGVWELQSKGAGETPYSRSGDGRAVLRSTVREYLCSEAMHALGIPTTRALCIIDSDEPVARERMERGALLLRMAPSHLRFGSFEVFYYRRQYDRLRELADYAVSHHFPELLDRPDRYLALFGEAVERTAELLAHWQQVGFAHGVMNTDNFSLLGLTLDYGPFGFMDGYEPRYICNHSDYTGRYAFDRQPSIGRWNLSRLGQAMLPLFDDGDAAAEQANAVLNRFRPRFEQHYQAMMRAKLGLAEARPGDSVLISGLLGLMAGSRTDYTRLFRELGDVGRLPGVAERNLRHAFVEPAGFDAWLDDYRARLQGEGRDDAERRAAMRRVNPRYILRNHLAQGAIDQAEQGDFGEVERLLALLRRPYDDQPGMETYAEEAPPWARHLEISCSS